MSLYPQLFNLLGPLVGSRAYADSVPLNTQPPYIRYQQIGGRKSNTVSKTSNSARGHMPLVQIDVHAKNAAGRDELLQAIDAVIDFNRAQGLKPRLQTFEHAEFSKDEDTKTYMAMLTYQVTSF